MTRPDLKSYYFDHAAATPMDPEVFEAMKPYLTTDFANPSSLYMSARRTRGAIDDARATIARILGAKPTEIVFTSGGTESNNLAIQGVLRRYPQSHWITSAIEHDAVLSQALHLQTAGHDATIIPVSQGGIARVPDIRDAIRPNTVLVSVMMANNEIGTIQPIAGIARLVAQVRAERAQTGNYAPLYLHTDAVQAAGYLDLHVTRLGVDLLSVSGSKIYGPKGTGYLYVRHTVEMDPLQYGGGQERTRRSGTENTAGIVGLAAAFKKAANLRTSESRRLTLHRDHILLRLQRAMPNVTVSGDQKKRLPNNINLSVSGVDGETLVLYLDKVGIMASTGSACSTGNLDPSHVLLAIGKTRDEAQSSLRLSLGRSTDQKAADHLLSVLPDVASRLRARG